MDFEDFLRLLRLWLPASLLLLTDWLRPLLFNLFVSANVKRSSLQPEEATLELDAVGLSVMSLNLLLFATAYGFNGAVDAYASVAFGAGNVTELNAILVRQFVLLCVLGAFAIFLFTHAETAFLLIGMEPQLADRAAGLLRSMSLAVPGDFAYDAISRWMRGQQLHRHVAACSVCALGLSLIVNLMLASRDQPSQAPVLALIVQNSALPFLLLGTYVSCGVVTAKARPIQRVGSRAMTEMPALAQVFGPSLWKQLGTGIASMIWTCAELWAWEVQVFEAQALGAGNAAAYTLLSSTYSLLICTFPVAAASASSALIGEALGQGDIVKATRILTLGCTLALLLIATYAIPLGMHASFLAGLLGGGVVEVSARYEHVLPVVLSMHLLDGLFNVLKAWLTVRRLQAFGAGMSLLIYYGCGVPLGYWLAFHYDWGLLGLWTGLGVAVLLGCILAAVQTTRDIDHALETSDPDDKRELEHSYLRFEEQPTNAQPTLPLDSGTSHSLGRQQRLRLIGFLVPGVIAFSAVLLWRAPWSSKGSAPLQASAEVKEARIQGPLASRLLQGASPCIWSTGGDFYRYPFVAHWDYAHRSYGWEVDLATSQGHANIRTPGSILHLGRNKDVYDVPYTTTVDPMIEVGWAVWLKPPSIIPAAYGDTWVSQAFVGTRISNAAHTFCGCQFMRGNRSAFRLTEHGRAQLPFGMGLGDGVSPANGGPWYLNLTRSKIGQMIEATCRPYAEQGCPVDNQTAFREWEERRDGGEFWTLKPWVEEYGKLPMETRPTRDARRTLLHGADLYLAASSIASRGKTRTW